MERHPEHADLVIRGGTVVTGSSVARASVVVRGGRISALCADSAAPKGEREFDATGKLVLPGVIDAHIHHRNYSHHLESFAEMSTTAAHGGVTTIIPFFAGREDMATLAEYIRAGIAEGETESVIDFGLHLRVRKADFELFKQLPSAMSMGTPSVKFSLGYRKRGYSMDDDHLLASMEQVREGGGLYMIHAENGVWMDYLENRQIAAGRTTPEHFYPTRPAEAELDAVSRVIAMNATLGGRVYFPHVTARLALEAIRAARAAGQLVYAETCPQYLLLTNQEVIKRGGLAKVGPPLRYRADLDALWQGLAEGAIQVVGSDHSCHHSSTKESGWKNIFEPPFGAPGTETLLPLLYSEGVVRGRIGLQTLVRVTSEHPARLFGLYPRKGSLAVGADADLAILDPEATWTVRAEEQHTPVDYSLYEGWEVHGKVVASFQRGEPLLADGQLHRPRGSGRFIPGRIPASGPLLD